MTASTAKSAYWAGLRDGLPFVFIVVPFAVLFGVVKIVLGFRAMFNHGVNKEAAVSLWIVILLLFLLLVLLHNV